MSRRAPMSKHPRLNRLWHAPIELGPVFFLFATWNWVNEIVLPHLDDAIREQRLLVGFLWFTAAIALFSFAGLTAVGSARRLNRPEGSS
jgi:hypothetical protein